MLLSRSKTTIAAALLLSLCSACDDAKADATEPTAEASQHRGGKLVALKASIDQGDDFEKTLAKVEAQMGASPLQQDDFWNFGEYDENGACVHMVLMKGGQALQQLQFHTYEPGSSGFGWCAEMKIDAPS